jgi:hypothetical protein
MKSNWIFKERSEEIGWSFTGFQTFSFSFYGTLSRVGAGVGNNLCLIEACGSTTVVDYLFRAEFT